MCAAMARTGARLRWQSKRPLIRCRLPGPQLPAQTARAPVRTVKRGEDTNQHSDHYVTLNIQVRVVRSGSPDGIAVRWTNDPNAPAMTVKEEDVLRRYPMNYSQLTKKLRERYADFKENSKYHEIRKPLENDKKYCTIRFFDPASARSGKKTFYNSEILKVFDGHYTKS
jgi:hypothetical protein